MKRRLLMVLALLGLASATLAQMSSNVRMAPAAGLSQLTTNGTTITSTLPILLPDGTAAAPSLAFTSATGAGLYWGAVANQFDWAASATYGGSFRGGGLVLSSANALSWRANATPSGAQDTILVRDAANTLALRNAGTAGTPIPQTFNVYNFCDGAACATGYERAAAYWSGNNFYVATQNAGTGSTRDIYLDAASNLVYAETVLAFDVRPRSADTYAFGTSAAQWQTLFLSRSVQGSKSKTLVDNTATAFVRLTVADDDYEGCAFGWTAYAEDADTDARQVRKGRTNVAILNNSGTEACNFSAAADDQAILVTAGTFTCTFDCNSAVADTVDLRATCDTSLNAAAETLTFEYRLDCESTITTITPQ